jgi:hypothetical protein
VGLLRPADAGLPDVLALPANGSARATIIVGRTPASTVASPLQITLGAGDQCTQGEVMLRPTKRGAAFP